MKQIFRFFRGELNGYFINALCVFPNLYIKTQEILEELYYQMRFQWALAGYEVTGKPAMREDDMFGIGKTGGLFQPRGFAKSSMGSIWFAPSSRVRYPTMPERSERGLVRADYEDFMFIRIGADNYPNDISREASEERRMTYRPPDAELLGYVASDKNLFERDGTIIVENLIPEPPIGQAYVEFYGLKYLHYAEQFEKELPLTPDIYKMLFEAVQRIRRHGANIKMIVELAQILGEGYIYDIEIVKENYWFVCKFSLDDGKQVFNRERRYAAWRIVMDMKYKEFVVKNRMEGE